MQTNLQEQVSLTDKKVSAFVSENIRTAHVFKKYGIDFCCGGGVSVARACDKAGVPVEQVLGELMNITESRTRNHAFNQWKLAFLADYIENEHHAYVRESLPLLLQYAEKVARVHGPHLPSLYRVYKLVQEIAQEMQAHMQKEEFVLFPFVRAMESAEGMGPLTPPFGTVENPIRCMEQEHEHAGNILKEISALTDGYAAPEWACNTFRALYAKLQEFEEDLHMHVHLENNILFPKAKAMEANLNSKS